MPRTCIHTIIPVCLNNECYVCVYKHKSLTNPYSNPKGPYMNSSKTGLDHLVHLNPGTVSVTLILRHVIKPFNLVKNLLDKPGLNRGA